MANIDREQSYNDVKAQVDQAAYLEKLEQTKELKKRIVHRQELEKLIEERAQQTVVAK